ncbi:Hypothetical protein AJAP_01770 [Amycolatopsis japonica]|uniref:Uncharacterized protein n=1 Tax=Amycolatopsis japonica TaxID=208439 RepID=A0A075USX8_9PSEU|nr:Hypothetical protein AJAP_01770 [Amycolatopsis japonica]
MHLVALQGDARHKRVKAPFPRLSRGKGAFTGKSYGLRAIPPITRDSDGEAAKIVFSSGCHAGA